LENLLNLESKKKNEPSSKIGAEELEDAPVRNAPPVKARLVPGFRDFSHPLPQLSAHTGQPCTQTPKRPYPCLECNRSFSYPSLLASHQRVHSG